MRRSAPSFALTVALLDPAPQKLCSARGPFTTLTHHPVLANGLDNSQIVVQRVQNQSDATSPAGRWLAEDISGGGVIDNLQTVLEIAADGTVAGIRWMQRDDGQSCHFS